MGDCSGFWVAKEYAGALYCFLRCYKERAEWPECSWRLRWHWDWYVYQALRHQRLRRRYIRSTNWAARTGMMESKKARPSIIRWYKAITFLLGWTTDQRVRIRRKSGTFRCSTCT